MSEWVPLGRFSRVSTKPGLLVVGDHIIQPESSGCVVTLNLRFTGFLSSLAVSLTASLIKQYMQLEAEGLKKRSET